MIAHTRRPEHDGGVAWEAAPPLPASHIDVDAARLWSESGCQAVTHPDAAVPARLVTTVAGIVARLDGQGAGVDERFGGRGLGALAERAATLLLRRSGRSSCGGGSRLLATADGWVAVTLARPTDRELLPAWLGIDPGAACVVSNADPWSEVARDVAARESAEVVECASALGLACARVGEVEARPAVLRLPLGDAAPRNLHGARVVNLASLWAGPLAALVLARLGADVVCVESTGRPDGSRATPHWFDAMHAGQRSVALDFRREEGIATLAALLSAADVVIEGSRPRALEQLGISATDLVRRGPRVWVSITGYGRAPETAMRVALGDDAAAGGGLVGWVDGGPVFIADAVADPLTGLVAANAIVDAVTKGGRWLVDVALARVASAVAPRDGDPVVPARSDASPARAVPRGAPPFELGTHTAQVLDGWLDQRGVENNLNI
jgi:hypothetical protein